MVKIGMNIPTILGVVILLGVAGVITGMIDLAQYIPGAEPQAFVSPQRQLISDCESTTTPELIMAVKDKVNQGTIRTSDFNVVVVLNDQETTEYVLATDAGADASPGDGFVAYAHASADNTTYIGQIITGSVPCEEREPLTFFVPTTGTMTLTASNSDNGLSNAEGDRQPIGAGERVSVDFEIKEATADACIGTEFSNKDLVICGDYNSSAYTVPEFKKDGTTLATFATPEGHTGLRNAVQDSTYCATITGVKEICDYAKETGFAIELEAKSSIDPQAGVGDVNLHLYIPQVFKNANTGAWDFEYSDTVNATQIITPLTGKINVE